MYIEYTKQEWRELEKIAMAFHKKAKNATQEEYTDLTIRRDEEERAFALKCQKARLDKLGGDPDLIIKDAKEQTRAAINNALWESLEICSIEELEKAGLGSRGKDGFVLDGKEAAHIIVDQLEIHFKELENDETATNELYEAEIEAINDNAFIGNKDEAIATIRKYALDKSARDRFAQNPALERRKKLEKIKKLGIMTDRLTSQIIVTDAFKQEINGQLVLKWAVDQAPKRNEIKVPVYLSLTYTGEDLKIKRKMTAYDKAVYEAVSTAFYYHRRDGEGGPLLITPQEIWRIMAGLANTSRTPSPKQLSELCDSMDKMRLTSVYMNISSELEANYIKFDDERVTEGEIETYLLEAEKARFVTEKGRILYGYRIKDTPILYSYNAAKGHLILAPYELLDTTGATGNEGNTILFRNYLLQEIGRMIEGSRTSPRILFDTIYKNTGITPPEERIETKETYNKEASKRAAIRRERKKDCDKITTLLTWWEEKSWIAGHALIKKGQTFIGVDIRLKEEEKTSLKGK